MNRTRIAELAKVIMILGVAILAMTDVVLLSAPLAMGTSATSTLYTTTTTTSTVWSTIFVGVLKTTTVTTTSTTSVWTTSTYWTTPTTLTSTSTRTLTTRTTATRTVTVVPMYVSYGVMGASEDEPLLAAPVFRYVLHGAARSLTLSLDSQLVWMDEGTIWSVTNPLRGSSSTERWCTDRPEGAWSPLTSAKVVFVFYHQTLQKLSYSVVGGGSGYLSPRFEGSQFGSPSPVILTNRPTGYWFDYGSSWTVRSNPLVGSTRSERWLTTQATTGTIGNPGTLAFTFVHQFYLSMTTKPEESGLLSPSSGWYNAGQTLIISANPNFGFKFTSWTGTGFGSYTGTSSSAKITMNSAITETANFLET